MFCEVLVKKDFLICSFDVDNIPNWMKIIISLLKAWTKKRWKIYILFKITVKFLIRADSEYFPFV